MKNESRIEFKSAVTGSRNQLLHISVYLKTFYLRILHNMERNLYYGNIVLGLIKLSKLLFIILMDVLY